MGFEASANLPGILCEHEVRGRPLADSKYCAPSRPILYHIPRQFSTPFRKKTFSPHPATNPKPPQKKKKIRQDKIPPYPSVSSVVKNSTPQNLYVLYVLHGHQNTTGTNPTTSIREDPCHPWLKIIPPSPHIHFS